MELSVTTSRQDDVSVVTVAGEIDVYTAALLRDVLDEEIAAGRSRLVVDLDDVTFLDSTGLGVLVGRLKLVRGHSGWLRIVRPNDRILSVFRITGLDKVFDIYRVARGGPRGLTPAGDAPCASAEVTCVTPARVERVRPRAGKVRPNVPAAGVHRPGTPSNPSRRMEWHPSRSHPLRRALPWTSPD